MAGAIVEVIGLLVGVLETIGFMSSDLPGNAPQPGDSKLRIAVALNGNGFSGADGTAPLIYAYNENKDFEGSSKASPNIDSGSFQDIVISQQSDVLSDSVLPWEVLSHLPRSDSDGKHHERNQPPASKPGEQATYLQSSATDNAICIAYLS